MITEALFTAEYTKSFQTVVWFLMRMGATRDDAADLAQGAWTRAWERRSQFRGDSSVATWVCTIARNHCLQELRRHKIAIADMPSKELASHSVSPEVAVFVYQLQRRLTKRDRWLFQKHILTGLTCDELAVGSGITVDGIKTRLFRARQLMRL